MIVKRPVSLVAIRQARNAVFLQRSREINPRLPMDVVELCRKEVQRVKDFVNTAESSPLSDLLRSRFAQWSAVTIRMTIVLRIVAEAARVMRWRETAAN